MGVFNLQMQINKKVVFLVIVILFFTFSNIVYSQGMEVIVEGMSEVSNGDLVQAKDMAQENALRNAVEQAVGVTIDAETKTENHELIEDSIYSQSRGYVSEYDIIDSRSEGDIFFIEIRAVVKEDILEDDLDDLDLVIHRAGDPRIMVIIPNEEYRQRRWNRTRDISDPAAESAITQKLLEAGFRLIDQNQIEEARDSEKIRRAVAGDAEAIHEIRVEYDADLLITGEAVTEFSEEIQGFYSYRASLNAQVVNTDTAEIVATHGLNQSGADVTETAAAKDSLASAGEKMGDYLLDVIPEAISDVERSVQISVSNVSFSEVNELEDKLKEMRFIDAVYMRDFSASSARFDLNTSLRPNQLARELDSHDDFSLEIIGVSGNKIDISN